MFYNIYGESNAPECPLFEEKCTCNKCAWFLDASHGDSTGCCSMTVSGHALWIQAKSIKSKVRQEKNRIGVYQPPRDDNFGNRV